MKKKVTHQKLNKHFVTIFENELLDEINHIGVFKKINKGDFLINIGDEMIYIPLILKGAIKIMREDENKDEILLYFLEPGDTCAISFINCINVKKSLFRGVAEKDTECILIPVNKVDDWISKYKSWRQFIFDSYYNRYIELIETIESLTFLKLDKRLVKYLLDKVKITKDKNLYLTHQEIAKDLNTSRVVISRLLKIIETSKKIKLGHKKIKVLRL